MQGDSIDFLGERQALVREHLKSAVVLIVDQNPSARVGIKKILASLGAPLNKILMASSFEEAEVVMKDQKPNLVFCDYYVGARFGIDLLQAQRERCPEEMKKSLFVLVTSNTSQSAVAQAAEEDVDAFILKPYTVESFVLSLTQAVKAKLHPSDYMKLIDAGKELLEKDYLDGALQHFEEAMGKDEKPSLACFYEGLVHFRKALLENSECSYQKGLSFNKIHYKCLVGLFDLFMSLRRFESAYEVVQRMVRFFPANPKRLATVLRLAIQTKHYSDVESFYQEFLRIDTRNDELVKCVCAALIVCAKHFFANRESATALDLLRKAAVTAAGRKFLLKKIVEVMVEQGEIIEAKAVLKRFPAQTNEDPVYAVAALLVASVELNPELVVAFGQELLRKGLKEPEVYKVTIEFLEKCGKKDRAQELGSEAVSLFPELSDEIKRAA